VPIPSVEHLEALNKRLLEQSQLLDSNSYKASRTDSGWLNWFYSYAKYFYWSSSVRLADCLRAFFSEDELKDDNMYSCEKCKK
jgi:ubiquitin C-terminal hydrolase